MNNIIEISELTYTYPKAAKPALSRIGCSVAPSDFVLIAGPSGAGKSTLIRCFNGLVPHFSGGTISGRIEVAGLDAVKSGPRPLSRLVGFVFQDPEAQFVLDRVEDEIAFGLENAAVPSQEMRLRVEEVLRLMELGDIRHRRLSSLSGGERQRVAIATALAGRPQILALDEPTSQLDPKSAGDLLQALVRLNEELGLTIILIEHRLERVARYADRLFYLEDGRLKINAPVHEGLSQVDLALRPPLARLAGALELQSMPLTIKEGARLINRVKMADNSNGSQVQAERPLARQGEPRIQARNLFFSYNGREVLHGVNMAVDAGEAVALIGRNGAGKSTLLRCLVGLLRPEKGEILLDGMPINGRRVAEIARQVAYLPQTPDDLLFADSVAAELEITLANHRLSPTDISPTPSELLNELGLDRVAAAYPRDLSVGQRQRVALGAVMVTAPLVLLLDEPTRGLDYLAKSKLVKIWRRWLEEGMGLLLVTHDVELAARVADRVVVLNDGEIIANGPTAEVLNASPLFSPQMARLFPGRGWLTVESVLDGLVT